MGLFFGTDGLRGRLEKGLSAEIAFRCGNALASINQCHKNQKILIGTDTRKTCDLLSLMFASGAMSAGADVVFVGVCPTAAIGFLTKEKGFDFGVVISASHNPAEFNGIKIFNDNGLKISEEFETEIEKRMLEISSINFEKIGRLKIDFSMVCEYAEFLKTVTKDELEQFLIENLSGLCVVLDTANGSASSIAPKVFEELGAKVCVLSNRPNGLNINKDCGSLHIQNLRQKVIETNADMGFAFDGDSDRLVAIDENGDVVDGDQLIYIFAKYYLTLGKLTENVVVGTVHTNSGIEASLNKLGLKLIRTNVGDKFVSDVLEAQGLLIGGEQSGHIFLKDKLQTGDGILNALILSVVVKSSKKTLSKINDAVLFAQTNLSAKVTDKHSVMANAKCEIDAIEKELLGRARVLVRPSGTEPIIRITVESEDKNLARLNAEKIKNIIEKYDKGDCLCVE